MPRPAHILLIEDDAGLALPVLNMKRQSEAMGVRWETGIESPPPVCYFKTVSNR